MLILLPCEVTLFCEVTFPSEVTLTSEMTLRCEVTFPVSCYSPVRWHREELVGYFYVNEMSFTPWIHSGSCPSVSIGTTVVFCKTVAVNNGVTCYTFVLFAGGLHGSFQHTAVGVSWASAHCMCGISVMHRTAPDLPYPILNTELTVMDHNLWCMLCFNDIRLLELPARKTQDAMKPRWIQ